MRKGMWSAAAVIAIAIVASPTVRAADTRVAMGSSDDPLAFAPADVTVPVGGSVEWFNDADLEHDVQAEDGSFGTPGSDLLGKGEKYEFRFSKAGTFKYFCTPHKSTGMVGTVTVSGGAPTTAAPTPTTAPPSGGATTTTTARGASTTTTRPGAGAPAGPTTSTTAGLGVTSTTQAASTTPTSAPDTGDVTSTTVATGTDGHGGGESAAETHGSEGGSDKKTNPVAVGLAGILTAVLTAVSLKLLTGKP